MDLPLSVKKVWLRIDLAVGILLSVFGVYLVSGLDHHNARHSGAAAAAMVLLMTLPVAWRRQAPVAVSAVLAAGSRAQPCRHRPHDPLWACATRPASVCILDRTASLRAQEVGGRQRTRVLALVCGGPMFHRSQSPRGRSGCSGAHDLRALRRRSTRPVAHATCGPARDAKRAASPSTSATFRTGGRSRQGADRRRTRCKPQRADRTRCTAAASSGRNALAGDGGHH